MDDSDYKAKKESDNAMRRSTLDDVVRVVHAQDSALAALLETGLRVTSLDTPQKHTGQSGSDWVVLSLSEDLAEAVLDCLYFAEISAVGLDGETTPEASHAARLVDAWQHWHDEA